jgi:hypothetical protein
MLGDTLIADYQSISEGIQFPRQCCSLIKDCTAPRFYRDEKKKHDGS